jgi:hypothetical protein
MASAESVEALSSAMVYLMVEYLMAAISGFLVRVRHENHLCMHKQ